MIRPGTVKGPNAPFAKTKSGAPQQPAKKAFDAFFVPVALLIIVLAPFAGIFRQGPDFVISSPSGDTDLYFYFWREFLAKELAKGHFPLWNPTVFSGTPFLGNWQSGCFYPPAWLSLLIPVGMAINLEYVLHVFLTGLFMAAWAKKYGFHPMSCLVAGVALMFGGAYYGHVYAGHLSMIEAMAWVPLVFLAVDHLLEQPELKWILTGAVAVAMMVLAGHPQTVFQAVIFLFVYYVLAVRGQRVRRTLGALLAVGVLVLGLSAAQLLPSLECASEWNRAVPSFQQSSEFSYPPAAFITLLVPRIFGTPSEEFYWGPMVWWEITPYLSVTLLPLLVLGLIYGPKTRRALWLALAVLAAVLMMGAYTPAFRIFYTVMPGASRFRGYCKLEFEFSLFACLLGAAGLDAVIRGCRVPRALTGATAAVALGLVLAGFAFHTPGAPAFIAAARRTLTQRESAFFPPPTSSFELTRLAAEAGFRLWLSAALLTITALALAVSGLARPRSGTVAAILATLCLLELAVFATGGTTAFESSLNRPTGMALWFKTHHGDFRVLQLATPSNGAVGFGARDVGGYDPLHLRRYTQLMNAAQGEAFVENAGLDFHRYTPVLALFRCADVILPTPNGFNIVPCPDVLPHGLFVPLFQVARNEDVARGAVLNGAFRPRQTVILESDPGLPPPSISAPTSTQVRIEDLNSDEVEVTADAPSAGIILVTDSYSQFWRADPGDGSAGYRVMPGNCAQIAIPVAPGHHHFLLTYRPNLFPVGCWISALSWTLCLGCAVWLRFFPQGRFEIRDRRSHTNGKT